MELQSLQINPQKTQEKPSLLSQLRLTERDLLALQWVCDQGAMNVHQLWESVWRSETSRSPKYVYDRVNLLTRKGYLFLLAVDSSNMKYFCATSFGVNAASRFAKSRVFLNSPRIDEVPHLSKLTDLRIALLRTSRLKQWQSDRALQLDPMFPRHRFLHYIPDAIWTTNDGGRVAI